jgi:small subunit ribosomal protein S21
LPGWRPALPGLAGKKPLTAAPALGLFLRFSFHHPTAYDRPMSIEIKIRKNEPIDRALRRMKKKLDRENIIKGTRAKRYYEKPCEKRRRKDKVQAFTQMLRRRYAE